jgi:hypothetical protein
MKYFLLFFLFLASSCFGKMYLKLDGTTIMGFHYEKTGEYTVEIPNTVLTENGRYIYKYDGRLILLTEQEILNHPILIESIINRQMIREKEKQRQKAIVDRDGVNATLLPLIRRLRPSMKPGIDFTIDPPGGGKSLYERLNMQNKPTFEEMQTELLQYRVDRKTEIDASE